MTAHRLTGGCVGVGAVWRPKISGDEGGDQVEKAAGQDHVVED